MRKLVVLVVLGVVLWCGYWFAAATALDRGLRAWIETRRADGWVAEASGIRTSGFPTRFETRVSGLELADPRAGLMWSLPEFRFAAASTSPTSIEAVWPGEQVLASPTERVTVRSDIFEAGIAFAPGPSLPLRSSSGTLSNVRLVSDRGWQASLETGAFRTWPSEAAQDAHEIAFDAAGVVPARAFRMFLDPAGLLPETIEGMSFEAMVDFDAPWDRRAIEDQRPQIERIDLKRLRAAWGPMEIRAAGAVDVDAEGRPEGRITLQLTNWREMVGVAVATGLVPAELAPTLERGLELLAGLSGRPDRIEAPLSFQKGFILLGPVPLGPAPNLSIR